MVTNQVKHGNLEIVNCQMDKMIGDYFTKELQGTKFSKFWKIMMGQK